MELGTKIFRRVLSLPASVNLKLNFGGHLPRQSLIATAAAAAVLSLLLRALAVGVGVRALSSDK